MWVKKIIAISDRHEVEGDFLTHIERLASAKIDALVLREKDLSEFEYFDLAKEVLSICKKKKLTCILHSFDRVALKLNCKFFHCPLGILKQEPRIVRYFHLFGTSVHSVDELMLAQRFKCNYAIAGHIFESLCKVGLESRGVEFLKELLKLAKIPIYAIGGINLSNLALLKDLDIESVCMRSVLMQEKNLKNFIKECRQILS